MILFFQTIAAAHQIATPEFIFITLYPFALSMLLCIDTAYFLVGYLTESRVLSNEVRSVDTSTLGWLSALACYPPLNEITRTFIGWHSSDFSNFGNLSQFVLRWTLTYMHECLRLGNTLARMESF